MEETNIESVKEALVAAGIDFSEEATIEELTALLPPVAAAEEVPPVPATEDDVVEVTPKEDVGDGITVQDPQVLRPKELPLVITPDSGSWENDAQAEYARTLNGYAYKNPKKWAVKKDVLITRLKEIGGNPDAIIKYRGNVTKLSFSNKLMGDLEE